MGLNLKNWFWNLTNQRFYKIMVQTFPKLEPMSKGKVYVYPWTMGLKTKELVLKLNQPELLKKSKNQAKEPGLNC